jgi:hypothetical protein
MLIYGRRVVCVVFPFRDVIVVLTGLLAPLVVVIVVFPWCRRRVTREPLFVVRIVMRVPLDLAICTPPRFCLLRRRHARGPLAALVPGGS